MRRDRGYRPVLRGELLGILADRGVFWRLIRDDMGEGWANFLAGPGEGGDDGK